MKEDNRGMYEVEELDRVVVEVGEGYEEAYMVVRLVDSDGGEWIGNLKSGRVEELNSGGVEELSSGKLVNGDSGEWNSGKLENRKSGGVVKIRRRPIGSTMRGGVFYWQIGAGYLGEYEIVFVNRRERKVKRVKIVVKPKVYIR